MDIKQIYNTYYKQFNNNMNKWPSIKHVTSNKAIRIRIRILMILFR